MNLQERDAYFKQQRETRGWDDSDLWRLDSVMAEFILSRLIEFKKLSPVVPYPYFYKKDGLTKRNHKKAQKMWYKVLDEMIAAFTLLAKNEISRESSIIIDQGLKQFCKHYRVFWW